MDIFLHLFSFHAVSLNLSLLDVLHPLVLICSIVTLLSFLCVASLLNVGLVLGNGFGHLVVGGGLLLILDSYFPI